MFRDMICLFTGLLLLVSTPSLAKNNNAVEKNPTLQNAPTLDLTYDGAAGFIAGAFFMEGTIHPAGTGVFEPFLRLQTKGIEEGFNTSVHKVLDNKDGKWTHPLLLESVPVVILDGVYYREFRLDINNNNSKNDKTLSLDELRIYTEDKGDISRLSDLVNLKYDLDTTGNNWLLLDYDLNSGGSGWSDMSVFIPEALFNGGKDYLYLYSKFGVNEAGSAGFEEWAADPEQPTSLVPEPSTFILLGAGLLGAGLARRKFRK